MTQDRIAQLKAAFNLKPHPEGGFYSEQYRSADITVSPRNQQTRNSVTHIYFLLTANDISRWHKVVHDEIWNVYEGAPLRILSFNENDKASVISDIKIGGSGIETTNDYFKVIEGGTFQAAESTGLYTFCGCSVAPGFDFEDFSYIENPDTKNWVIKQELDYKKFL